MSAPVVLAVVSGEGLSQDERRALMSSLGELLEKHSPTRVRLMLTKMDRMLTVIETAEAEEQL